MTRHYLHATLALLFFATWPQASARQHQEQAGVVAKAEDLANKMRIDHLKIPRFITMDLVPMRRDGKSDTIPFRVGEGIRFKLIMTQSLNESLDIVQTDVYDQDRPELLRDGDHVPYKKRIADLVRKKDEKPQIFSEKPMTIMPGQPSAIAIIDLDEWFNRLQVGHYQLSVQHRFVWGGEWVQSHAVTFEIQ